MWPLLPATSLIPWRIEVPGVIDPVEPCQVIVQPPDCAPMSSASLPATKIFSLAFHPYLSGAPHQIKYLEQLLEYAGRHEGVAFWTGEQILDWYRGARPR